jgi:hypothetical protein
MNAAHKVWPKGHMQAVLTPKQAAFWTAQPAFC